MAVFVTHAHIDHIGRLPQFVRAGFRGTIYSTPPTKDFGELLLLDSEHILREEAGKKHKAPLYGIPDVVATMGLWQKRSYHEKIVVGPFTVEFINAGHILGSSSIVVCAEGKKIVFSGDLGNIPAPFITGTEYVADTDYALIESVYGGRIHENLEVRKEVLEDMIEDTVKKGGVFMIPAFALERTQEMIYELNELVEHGRVPRTPVFIDSPLAIKLTAIYQKYSADQTYFNADAIQQIARGDAIFNFPGLTTTLTTEESKHINEVPAPKIIIAGSGMSNAGRILHHEARYLSDQKNTILIVGYQAHGSLGRELLDKKPSVRIFGEDIPVRCRVKAIGGYSAHADQPQLLQWIAPMKESVKKLFIVQGEEDQAKALMQKVRDELAVNATIPSPGETVVI